MYILAALITLAVSAFFSGIEIAYYSANKLQVELKRKEGTRASRLLSNFFDNESKFIGSTLVGNNIALVLFGILMNLLFMDKVKALLPVNFQNDLLILLLMTIITTVIVLIFGEFFPKALFRLNPVWILEKVAIPLNIIWWLLTPIVFFTMKVSYFLIKTILRAEVKQDEQAFTKLDLENYIQTIQSDSDDEIDTDLFENALYLPTLKVKESMVPRTEIVGVDIKDGLEVLKATFIENRMSRIIIYNDNLDEILGYAHHQQMLKDPKDIKKVILPLKIVPEVMPLRDLMNLFIKQQISIALVVDEFGGTAGIITMEDIVEEIVGEIEDEHDDPEHTEIVINENEFVFSGRLEVDYLNEKYDFDLPEGEYQSLSGYLVTTAETIPVEDQQFEFDNYRFILEKVSETKIEIIRMQRIKEEEME